MTTEDKKNEHSAHGAPAGAEAPQQPHAEHAEKHAHEEKERAEHTAESEKKPEPAAGPEAKTEEKAAAKPEAKKEPEKQPDHAAKFAAQLAAAEEKAAQMEKKVAEVKDTLLRTAAEYDNYRKRSTREHDAAYGNGVAAAVEALLPVVDTLALAANASCTDETYKKGVLMTLNQCKAAFEKLGVKEMDAVGRPFDPQLHEAVMQQPAPEGTESGTVLQVLKTGYERNGKVVRHATVIVAE